MQIPIKADWTTREVFKSYERDDMQFRNTQVPVKLVQYSNEPLVSRSQAKRLLSRFDEFNEVLLDFQGIDEVGRAFIDEIFRVFRFENPKTVLTWLNVTEEIHQLIKNAIEMHCHQRESCIILNFNLS